MNLNKVFLIGNLTRDPEFRTLPSGRPVASFGLATNATWTDQSGKRQTAVEYHNLVAFGKLAEIAKQYLTKGKMVFIEGRLQTRSWDGQDGLKKNRTEIIIQTLQMGPRSSLQATPTPADESKVETIEYPHDEGEINPDEIPF